MFKYFQCEGRFPPTKKDVLPMIVHHIAESLDLSVEAWRRYDWQGRTIDERRGREITDNLVELLLQVVHRIGARAEKQVDQEILEEFKKVTGKNAAPVPPGRSLH